MEGQHTVTGQVSDHGDGPADPLISYRPPPHDANGGPVIAQQLCGRGGTTVIRFAVALLENPPGGALQHSDPTE
jgi:hypothetical protein